MIIERGKELDVRVITQPKQMAFENKISLNDTSHALEANQIIF